MLLSKISCTLNVYSTMFILIQGSTGINFRMIRIHHFGGINFRMIRIHHFGVSIFGVLNKYLILPIASVKYFFYPIHNLLFHPFCTNYESKMFRYPNGQVYQGISNFTFFHHEALFFLTMMKSSIFV